MCFEKFELVEKWYVIFVGDDFVGVFVGFVEIGIVSGDYVVD